MFGILAEMGRGSVPSRVRPTRRYRMPHLGTGYSEVYPVEDLIWDNTNKALLFREDILNIHQLDDDQLYDLLERLREQRTRRIQRYRHTDRHRVR